MSLFDSLKKAIFYNPMARSPSQHTDRPATPASGTRPAPSTSAPTRAAPAQPTGAAAPAQKTATAPPASAAPPPAEVDVEAVLESLNSHSAQKLNWRTSIVDLMKLVGLDPSLQHRKELAAELGYTGDTNDSAAMNIWLHKTVMKKLAQNGGKVPATLQ